MIRANRNNKNIDHLTLDIDRKIIMVGSLIKKLPAMRRARYKLIMAVIDLEFRDNPKVSRNDI